jgi:hypothetical protein
MRKINRGLLAFLQLGPLHAAVHLNDQQTLEIVIPQDSLTRLSVQEDVIQDIFVYPQMIGGHLVQDSLQLHKAGHVFIAPEQMSQPFYLTVMTQKGKVQDLKVIPGSHGSGPVILMVAVPDRQKEIAKQHHQKRQEAALMAALQGFVPPDFHKVSFEKTSEEPGDIQKIQVEAYVNQSSRIDVYTLDNRRDREIFLTPALFLGPSDLAVVFDGSSLPAGGQVRLAILRQGISSPSASRKPISLTPTPTSTHKG